MRLPEQIVIALIAALGSLVASIISLIIAILNNRSVKNNHDANEKLKFELESRKTKNSHKLERLMSEQKALQEAIQSIQIIKDEIQLILNSIESSLDCKTALTSYKEARKHIFEVYEGYISIIDDYDKNDKKTFHKAKCLALDVEIRLVKSFTGKVNVSELTTVERNYLKELRYYLTENQASLSNSKLNQFIKMYEDEVL